MATALAAKSIKDFVFEWEGKDKNGKIVRGEVRSGGEAAVSVAGCGVDICGACRACLRAFLRNRLGCGQRSAQE